MSETKKKEYNYNSCAFKEEGKSIPTITTGDSDSRSSDPVPEFPKLIEVDSHSFQIEPDGTITRLDTKTGKKLGTVENKKDQKFIKENSKEMGQDR